MAGKMTMNDFAICLNELVGAYPGKFEVNENMVKVWHSYLGEISNKDLWHIIRKYVRENKYPPSISDLLETQKQIKRESEGWHNGTEREDY